MIPTIAPIKEYNPATHTTPILWFKSKLLTKLRIGGGERMSNSMTVANFPENCIVVKVARGYHNKTNNINGIGLVQIYFVGQRVANGYRTWPSIKRVLLWVRHDSKTNKLDSISFSVSSGGADNSIEGISDMITYVNHIIKQLNTL
jgi:hypothetical protein